MQFTGRNFAAVAALSLGGLASAQSVVSWGRVGFSGIDNIDLAPSRAFVSTGTSFFAIRPNGLLAAWGAGSQGQMAVPLDLGPVIDVDCYRDTVVALTADGRVVCWGSNSDGQAVPPAGLTGARAVGAGQNHSMAITSYGTVVCWGSNIYGQCSVPWDLGACRDVAGGLSFTVAVKHDGGVRCWGLNTSGQCNAPGDLDSAVKVYCGTKYAAAVLSDGSVACWGDNTAGNCNVPAGLNGVRELALVGSRTLALREDGSIVCWGTGCNVPANLGPAAHIAGEAAILSDGKVVSWGSESGNGAPGGPRGVPNGLRRVIQGRMIDYQTILLNSDGSVECIGTNSSGQAEVPADLGPCMQVGIGSNFCAALRTDGTVVTWGSPVQPVPNGLRGVKEIAVGSFHMLAVTVDGGIVGWGSNTFNASTPPADVGVVAHAYAGYLTSFVIRTDGTARGWGTTADSLNFVPSGTMLKIDPADHHAIGIRGNGTVVCWGSNYSGECDVPAGLTDVVDVAAGRWQSMAVRADGSLVTWGASSFGGLPPPAGVANVAWIDASPTSERGLIGWTAARSPDLDHDGQVGGGDLGMLLAMWGQPCYGSEADLNYDGVVDGMDLGVLLGAW